MIFKAGLCSVGGAASKEVSRRPIRRQRRLKPLTKIAGAKFSSTGNQPAVRQLPFRRGDASSGLPSRDGPKNMVGILGRLRKSVPQGRESARVLKEAATAQVRAR